MSTPTAVLDHHWLLSEEVSVSLHRRSTGEAIVETALITLASPWHLAVLNGPDRGLVVVVRDSAFLGRGGVLNDPLVSCHRPRLHLHGGRTLAQDYGSADGSYCYRYLRLWLCVCRETRMKEGTLLRLGDSVLKLRRRPCDLVVAVPATQTSSMVWLMVGSLVCVLVMGGSAVIAFRTDSRGVMGMVMVVPMAMMTIMRLVPFLQQRRAQRVGYAGHTGGAWWCARRYHQGRRPGWGRNEPDPATMLLVATACSSMPWAVRNSRFEGSTSTSVVREILATWGTARRRRCTLALCDGESLVLVNKGADNALRWWRAQFLTQDEVRVTVLNASSGTL